MLRDLERTLAGARNNAKIFKQVEIELGDIAIAANKAELRLKDYAGAFINVSGSKDAIDSAMVNTLDTAWRKVGEAKDIYNEFITQLPVKYLLDLPLKQISAAKETLGRLRDGRLRLVKKPNKAEESGFRFAGGEVPINSIFINTIGTTGPLSDYDVALALVSHYFAANGKEPFKRNEDSWGKWVKSKNKVKRGLKDFLKSKANELCKNLKSGEIFYNSGSLLSR